MKNFLDNSFFENNRKKLARALERNSVAVIASNKTFDNLPFKFIQNKNLFYLTGIEQEGTILIIFSQNGDTHEEILFLQNPNVDPVWNGERLTQTQAKEISGINKIKFYDDVKTLNLKTFFESCDEVYTNFFDPLTFLDENIVEWPSQKNVDELMSVIRMKKEIYEIECIRKACEITKKGFDEVYKFLKPGMKEYELEGILEGSFIKNGSRYPSFSTIVASGKNACTLHYNKNFSQCQDGELVLIDTGSEFCNYCSDVTRVLSISGNFSQRQEKIYNSVLNISTFAKSIVKVGITFKELQCATVEKTKEELSKLGLLRRSELEGDEYKKFFMHGVSHSLGLDVHDVVDRNLPFCENMVITIEPGIYVREEKIGIRLEDDVVVKDWGYEVLSEEVKK